jgi:hypothetical protein
LLLQLFLGFVFICPAFFIIVCLCVCFSDVIFACVCFAYLAHNHVLTSICECFFKKKNFFFFFQLLGLDFLCSDDRVTVPTARLEIVGSLDRGPRGVPREPSIRGEIVSWFGGLLGPRDWEAELRSDIRPAWEHRLEVSFPPPSPPPPPFVIHFESFRRAESPGTVW